MSKKSASTVGSALRENGRGFLLYSGLLYLWSQYFEFTSWIGTIFARWPVFLFLFMRFCCPATSIAIPSFYVVLQAVGLMPPLFLEQDDSGSGESAVESDGASAFGIVDGCLELVDIEGKGRGFQAARAIKKGEALVCESPLVSCRGSGGEVVRALENKCSQSKRGLISSLTSQDGWDSHLQGCFANNAFMSRNEPRYAALFFGAAHFNHSCCPNAYNHQNETKATVRALQDIAKGDEVCISYVGVTADREQRHKLLEEKNFVCNCARCIAEKIQDPQLAVTCECNHTRFDVRVAVPSTCRCEKCGQVFDHVKSMSHWREIKKMNLMLDWSEEARNANKEILLQMLIERADKFKTDSPCVAPPLHTDAMQLFANVSNTAFSAAKVATTKNKQRIFSESCRKMGLEQLRIVDQNLSQWTNQRDPSYLQRLECLMQVDFTDIALREDVRKKAEALCLLHFGKKLKGDMFAH